MIKEIKIDNKDVKFSFGLASFYIYKNQFGQDAMTVILPLISDIVNALDPKIFFEKREERDEALIEAVGSILDEIARVEITELTDIIWAFAKAADSEIPEPMKWYASFDEFPIYDVGKELLPCLYESLISKKKIPVSIQTEKEAKKK
ncbi:MAG: hypothetical protein E7C95_00420 [Anaerococcus prevotii]|uniref:hypothetical protein n=1 Tax=Anaerococcus prevotii TaxID=33034 RepID=UPI002903FA09|nr:hypothetical protein [Anaerococcus prevotii]MDU2557416.1 hypothetical protein [Anaerococcus prevotii]